MDLCCPEEKWLSLCWARENGAWARRSRIFTALRCAGLYSRAGSQQWRRDSALALWWRYSGCGQERYWWWQRTKSARDAEAKSQVSNLVKEFGCRPVGSGSLRTVWRIHSKGLSLEAGSPARRALPLGLCLLLECPLALWMHCWGDNLPSWDHQIGNHSQKTVTDNNATSER